MLRFNIELHRIIRPLEADHQTSLHKDIKSNLHSAVLIPNGEPMETINVLLLADNPRDVQLFQMVLSEVKEPNFNIFHCHRLEEVKSILCSSEIDVAFVDLSLQNNNGIDIVSDFIKMNPQLAIIVLIGLLEEELGRSAVQVGAQDFIIKGEYDEEVLVRSIHYAISRQKMANSLLSIEDRTHRILESSPDGIILVDNDQIIQYMNPPAETLLQKEEQTLIGTEITFSSRTGSVVEFHHNDQLDEVTTVQLFAIDIEWDGKSSKLLSLRDITEKVELEKKLRYMATHDHLTEIANRTIFEDRLQLAIERYFRYSQIASDDFFFCIILLDLDDFKHINDTYGHSQGDQLLLECARRLEDTMRDSDTVARFSGDEFVVIAENINHYKDAEQLVRRMMKSLEAPIKLENTTVQITTSIGISCYPCDGMDYQTMFKNADIALHRAKQEKNRFCFFSQYPNNEDESQTDS